MKSLRKRAGLTQRQLALAVGYSEAHISRLERNRRLPDITALTTLFVPALGLHNETHLSARLLELAQEARLESISED